jgi:hypothetical protein
MSLFFNAPTPFITGGAGGGAVTAFTHVAASYERSTTNTSEKTFTPPVGAQAGDLLFLTTWIDDGYRVVTTPPSGWTEIGNNTSGSEYPEGYSYYQIYDGSTSSWTLQWNGSDTSAGIVVAFRPDNPITTVTTEQFQEDDGSDPSGLSNTISSVTDTNAPGGRIYMYFLTGRPTRASGQDVIQNPTPTFSPSTGWTHVDGDPLATEDYMDYAYKLASAGDAFVSTTITTTDTGRQGQHFFIVNAI